MHRLSPVLPKPASFFTLAQRSILSANYIEFNIVQLNVITINILCQASITASKDGHAKGLFLEYVKAQKSYISDH
jgi:hypothetical protein